MVKLNLLTALVVAAIATLHGAVAIPFNPVLKIAGGDSTTVTQFPFAVRILFGAGSSLDFNSRALRSRKSSFGRPSTYRINIGQDSNITYTPIVPKNIYAHPKYNWTEFINDIALLELKNLLQFTDTIQPIKLIRDESKLSGKQKFTAIGWGMNQNKKIASLLNRVDISNGSPAFCAKASPSYSLYRYQLLCTANVFGKDTCGGDSGGPLLVEVADSNGATGVKAATLWLQAAVTSFGQNSLGLDSSVCGIKGNVGFYARIDYFVSWIAKTTGLRKNQFTAPLPKDFEVNRNKLSI
ncbi:trypsin-like cysteine/serine peptidase domain-containing protein [Syncephalis fuscata]|nr:trypsin-like cysteine/serine peptidase domain-containing protein [Syncephalis fuscata]